MLPSLWSSTLESVLGLLKGRTELRRTPLLHPALERVVYQLWSVVQSYRLAFSVAMRCDGTHLRRSFPAEWIQLFLQPSEALLLLTRSTCLQRWRMFPDEPFQVLNTRSGRMLSSPWLINRVVLLLILNSLSCFHGFSGTVGEKSDWRVIC